MLLKSNHPFFTTSDAMLEIAKPLQKYGITYFTYSKMEINGSRNYLSTHPEILENYINQKYCLIGNVESHPKNYQTQTVLWSTLPKQHIYNDLVRPRNIDHGIFMIEPAADYCEYFGFAAHKDNNGIINFYLNNLDFLKKFCLSFKEKAATILKHTDEHKIILPFHNDKLIFTNNELVNGKIKALDLSTLSNELSLTPRQLECCQLLISGYTAREIAKILGLSSRTIEHYLLNIKSRLQCRTKSELIRKIIEMLSFN